MASIFGGEQPAQVLASIVDSSIDVAGDISVTALNEAQINATVGNTNISDAELDIVIPGLLDGRDNIYRMVDAWLPQTFAAPIRVAT